MVRRIFLVYLNDLHPFGVLPIEYREGGRTVKEDGAQDSRLDMQGILDWSVVFLLVIIASILMSYFVLCIQRRQQCLLDQGRTEEAACLPEVFPVRWRASAMIAGATGFFLWIAWRIYCAACEAGTCVERKSAWSGLLAAALVFAAALIRMGDLEFTGRQAQGQSPQTQAALEETLTAE